jgi:hypothetical protein
MKDRLLELIDQVRSYEMTAEEIAEQRVGFAYGNASKDNHSSKEDVRQAVNNARAPELRM